MIRRIIMSIIRRDTKSFVGSLFILAVFLAMLPASFAKDYETPHRFEAGDVIPADMMNEVFSAIEHIMENMTTADIVGTYTVTHHISPGTSGNTKDLVMDADGILGTRTDTLEIFDDGDGTYSYQTSQYHSFNMIADGKGDLPGPRLPITVLNNLAILHVGSNNMKPHLIRRESPTRIVFTYVGSTNSYIHIAICDKLDVAPNNPTDLSATSSGLTVTLSWTDTSDDETGFKVMRKDTLEGEYTEITTTAADATSYDDTVPSAGDYWYRIKATNDNGDSLGSNIVKVTVAE